MFYFIFEKILALFVKRWYYHLNKKGLDPEQYQYERDLSHDEHDLNNFSLIIEDRVSKQRVDYAREMLIETPSFFHAGRRRGTF